LANISAKEGISGENQGEVCHESSELQKIGNGQIANNFGIQAGYIFTLTSLGLRLDRRRHFSGMNLGPLGGIGIG